MSLHPRVIGIMLSLAALALVALAPDRAFAHDIDAALAGHPHTVWSLDPLGIALLALLAAIYALGQWRLRHRAHADPAPGSLYFWSGWVLLVVSLGPPLDTLSAVSFAAHMTQHEIMMLLAAPLLVIARPLGPLLWGLPTSFATVVKLRAVRTVAGWISAPLAAWLFHTIALWGWHVPSAFEAGLRSDAFHWLQHLTFFAAAVVFWWSILAGGKGGRRGVALISVFTTALHTSVLGVLLTFSTRVWYRTYADADNPWQLSALEDQQLGGLIMWVPGGTVFLVAALVLAALWLKEAEMRSARS